MFLESEKTFISKSLKSFILFLFSFFLRDRATRQFGLHSSSSQLHAIEIHFYFKELLESSVVPIEISILSLTNYFVLIAQNKNSFSTITKHANVSGPDVFCIKQEKMKKLQISIFTSTWQLMLMSIYENVYFVLYWKSYASYMLKIKTDVQ